MKLRLDKQRTAKLIHLTQHLT